MLYVKNEFKISEKEREIAKGKIKKIENLYINTEPKGMKFGSPEYYLWHDPNNEKLLMYFLVFTFFGMFTKNCLIGLIILWIWYMVKCVRNNNKLIDNQHIREKRIQYWCTVLKNRDGLKQKLDRVNIVIM